MRIILFILIAGTTIRSFGQSDEDQILAQANQFSAYLMAGEKQKVVEMYTADGKIFPNNREILEGDDLSEYWNPSNPGSWKTTYHKITPVELKVWGNEAYDYGYYKGKSSNGNQESEWRGKYVIIWRKEEGIWKIYLDIWNSIK